VFVILRTQLQLTNPITLCTSAVLLANKSNYFVHQCSFAGTQWVKSNTAPKQYLTEILFYQPQIWNTTYLDSWL